MRRSQLRSRDITTVWSMKRSTVLGGGLAALFILIGIVGLRFTATPRSAIAADQTGVAGPVSPGLIYGRITVDGGQVFEGQIRLGGQEEALWSNQFNGAKADNPWVEWVPHDERPREYHGIELFGLRIGFEGLLKLDRPFMARFGDIASIEPSGRDLRVTMRSGTEFELDRFGSDDLGDQITIWDRERGALDLSEWKIQSIEFLAPPAVETAPNALTGTVRTRHGDFSGLIQWDRELALTTDLFHGMEGGVEVQIPFSEIQAITRLTAGSSTITLTDGSEVVVSGTRNAGPNNRGVYVDDPRYGRVLVSWNVFDRLELDAPTTGPARADFPVGRPLQGMVTTRSGQRLTGRLVYDLDESETTETLDAARGSVHYNIPMGMIASIQLPGTDAVAGALATVALLNGEEIELELSGDLQWTNAGILVFGDGVSEPEYLPWAEVARIEFETASEG